MVVLVFVSLSLFSIYTFQSSGQDSTVHINLKEKGPSFKDNNVHVLDSEDRWFEKGVKVATYVKLEQPSLNIGGCLRHKLSDIYKAVFKFPYRKPNHCSHIQAKHVEVGALYPFAHYPE